MLESESSALPLGDTPVTKDMNLTIHQRMVGVAGFEPAHDGIKTRCLTAWLYPYISTNGGDGGI